jgi:UDP-N-acetylmuramate dehydrogenase
VSEPGIVPSSTDPGLAMREAVPLAPYTTLGVGGPARFMVDASDEATVIAADEWARRRGLALLVLGGGSNVVVADEGVDALVVRIASRGVSAEEGRGAVHLSAAAGEPWDELVRLTVARGWAGLECLSGIPGLVGATPIQNVGAYGQEVSATVTTVRALDRRTGSVVTLGSRDCAFAYRDSLFKSGEPGRHVVLSVTYRLVPGAPSGARYADVERHLQSRGVGAPSLADVRDAVLAIRRTKSMVLDDRDPNRRSCGSFFVNPIVTAEEVRRVEVRAGDPAMPRWPERDGRVKLSAAWLIEHAGFRRGHVEGTVGLSTRHALAVVAHEGAAARDVTRFARRIQDTVTARFGVQLAPEPVLWGFARSPNARP